MRRRSWPSTSADSDGTQTITLAKGSVFAYKLDKVKEWNKDKTQNLNMEAGYKGMH